MLLRRVRDRVRGPAAGRMGRLLLARGLPLRARREARGVRIASRHLLDDPTTWDAWFVPYFDLIRSEGIGAFCYSNRDYTQVPAWADWGDLRIERSPLKDEWAAMLAQPWVVDGS